MFKLHIYTIALLALITLIGSCADKKTSEQEPLARVYDKYLYDSEIKGLFNEGISAEDSVRIVQNYIDNWIRHNLALKIAEDNLQAKLTEIEKQTREYRESLLIYAYERHWLAENMDTIVQEDSLLTYYETNLKEFALQSDIYKISYAKTPIDFTKYDSLRFWMTRDIPKFRNDMELFCLKYCPAYFFEGQSWLDNNALFNLFPVAFYANGKFRTTQVIEYADDNFRYIVKVHDYITQGSQAPFEYVANDIKRIVLNKRKLLLLKSNYQKLYGDAFKKNNAEIFTTE